MRLTRRNFNSNWRRGRWTRHKARASSRRSGGLAMTLKVTRKACNCHFARGTHSSSPVCTREAGSPPNATAAKATCPATIWSASKAKRTPQSAPILPLPPKRCQKSWPRAPVVRLPPPPNPVPSQGELLFLMHLPRLCLPRQLEVLGIYRWYRRGEGHGGTHLI